MAHTHLQPWHITALFIPSNLEFTNLAPTSPLHCIHSTHSPPAHPLPLAHPYILRSHSPLHIYNPCTSPTNPYIHNARTPGHRPSRSSPVGSSLRCGQPHRSCGTWEGRRRRPQRHRSDARCSLRHPWVRPRDLQTGRSRGNFPAERGLAAYKSMSFRRSMFSATVTSLGQISRSQGHEGSTGPGT